MRRHHRVPKLYIQIFLHIYSAGLPTQKGRYGGYISEEAKRLTIRIIESYWLFTAIEQSKV